MDSLTGGAGADDFIVDALIAAGPVVEKDTITDFKVAETDQVGKFSVGDIADLVTLTTLAAATTDVADTNAVTVATGNIGAALDLGGLAAAANLLIATGDYADAAAVQAAVRANVLAGSATTADEGFLIAWDNGTNTYIGTVDYEAVEADGDAIDAAVVTELVQLTGVADATTLTDANFLNFIA